MREAYLQFMITIAKMIREDKNVSRDDSFVQEEMAKVMEFETEIANVSRVIKNSSGKCGGQGLRGKRHLLVCAAILNAAENPRHTKSGGRRVFVPGASPKIRASVSLILPAVCTAAVLLQSQPYFYLEL